MQGREHGEGMGKSETGLRSLGQGSQIRVWNGEGQAGSSTWSSKNGTKVVGGRDTRWKILEGLGSWGHEGWSSGVAWSVTIWNLCLSLFLDSYYTSIPVLLCSHPCILLRV